MSAVIKRTFSEGSIVDRVGGRLSQPGWSRIRRELDPREFGAAPLLVDAEIEMVCIEGDKRPIPIPLGDRRHHVLSA